MIPDSYAQNCHEECYTFSAELNYHVQMHLELLSDRRNAYSFKCQVVSWKMVLQNYMVRSTLLFFFSLGVPSGRIPDLTKIYDS